MLIESHIGNQKTVRFFALSGASLAFVLALTAMISGPGTRLDMWDFRTGLKVLAVAAYGEIAAFLLSLVGSIMSVCKGMKRMLALSLAGIAISLTLAGVMLSWWQTVKHVPPIHDITTDTVDPPQFVRILELRKGSPNPPEYGGQTIADQQRKAYPGISPAKIEVPPAQAFERALALARSKRWEIVNADSKAGIIEATDTTFWFGFKDDIVIRITPLGKASRVDLRSVSRVGKSDVGTNAKRIRDFLRRLKQV